MPHTQPPSPRTTNPEIIAAASETESDSESETETEAEQSGDEPTGITISHKA